jgi:broad specificity phosphatase PhoE
LKIELKEYTEEFDSLPNDKKWDYKFPSIETDGEVISRVLRFLREIAVGNPGKNVLIVTHAGVIGNLLIHLGVWNYQDQYSKKLNNAGYLKIESDGIDFFVKDADGIDIL